MKLRQRPHESPVGVKFKFSDEHSLPSSFNWELPPGSQISNGKLWSEEWRSEIGSSTTTWKVINIFQVKNGLIISINGSNFAPQRTGASISKTVYYSSISQSIIVFLTAYWCTFVDWDLDCQVSTAFCWFSSGDHFDWTHVIISRDTLQHGLTANDTSARY